MAPAAWPGLSIWGASEGINGLKFPKGRRDRLRWGAGRDAALESTLSGSARAAGAVNLSDPRPAPVRATDTGHANYGSAQPCVPSPSYIGWKYTSSHVTIMMTRRTKLKKNLDRGSRGGRRDRIDGNGGCACAHARASRLQPAPSFASRSLRLPSAVPHPGPQLPLQVRHARLKQAQKRRWPCTIFTDRVAPEVPGSAPVSRVAPVGRWAAYIQYEGKS